MDRIADESVPELLAFNPAKGKFARFSKIPLAGSGFGAIMFGGMRKKQDIPVGADMDRREQKGAGNQRKCLQKRC